MSLSLILGGFTDSPYYLPTMIGLLVLVIVGFVIYKKKQAS